MYKVCFVGNFIKSQFRRTGDEEFEYFFIKKAEDLDLLIKQYDYVFLTNDTRDCLVMRYFIDSPYIIKIKKGTVENCAETIIYFCGSGIGIDMADFCGALRNGKYEIHFYGYIGLDQIMKYNDFFNRSVGLVVKIHLSNDTNISLEKIEEEVRKIHIACNENDYLAFNFDFLDCIHEDVCDVFIAMP